jgi:hypothetical protein
MEENNWLERYEKFLEISRRNNTYKFNDVKIEVKTISNNGVIGEMTNKCMFISIYNAIKHELPKEMTLSAFYSTCVNVIVRNGLTPLNKNEELDIDANPQSFIPDQMISVRNVYGSHGLMLETIAFHFGIKVCVYMGAYESGHWYTTDCLQTFGRDNGKQVYVLRKIRHFECISKFVFTDTLKKKINDVLPYDLNEEDQVSSFWGNESDEWVIELQRKEEEFYKKKQEQERLKREEEFYKKKQEQERLKREEEILIKQLKEMYLNEQQELLRKKREQLEKDYLLAIQIQEEEKKFESQSFSDSTNTFDPEMTFSETHRPYPNQPHPRTHRPYPNKTSSEDNSLYPYPNHPHLETRRPYPNQLHLETHRPYPNKPHSETRRPCPNHLGTRRPSPNHPHQGTRRESYSNHSHLRNREQNPSRNHDPSFMKDLIGMFK